MAEEPTAKEALAALKELKGTVEKHGTNSPEYKEMVDKTEKALAENDKKSEDLAKALAAEKKKIAETDSRIKDLEETIATRGNGGGKKDAYRDSAEYKALNAMAMVKDVSMMTPDQAKTIRTDSNAEGGWYVPEPLVIRLMDEMDEISDVRPFISTERTAAKSSSVVASTKTPEAYYEGEAEEDEEDGINLRAETLTNYRLGLTIPTTQDALMASAQPLEDIIFRKGKKGIMKKENRMYIVGNTPKVPEGMLANAEVLANAFESSTIGAIDWKDMLRITGQLVSGYAPMFAMNRRTLAELRVQVDDAGNPVFQIDMRGAAPNTIAGHNYAIWPDMPDIGAGTYPVMFGDFAEAYLATDWTEITVIRDPYSKKRKQVVEFTMAKWGTGQVVMPEAIIPLKIKAA